jgi:predicted small secreted protein
MKKHFLPFIILVAIAFLISSCFLNIVEPSGEYISKDYNVRSFENVSVSAGMEVILTQDTTTSIRVETYENIFDYLIVKVVNNTLVLTKNVEVLFKNPRIKVYVNVDYLEKIVASSGSKLDLTSGWIADDLYFEMSSGSSAMGTLVLNELNLTLSSGSSAKFEGVADDLNVEASSGSSFRGLDVNVLNGRVFLYSASYAEINASETLYVEGFEASIVRYKGAPDITVKTSSGASVIKLP